MSSKNYEENLPRYLQSDKMEPSNISVIHLPKSDDHNNHEVTFEEALKIIGFGKVHVQLLLIISLILMTVLNETMGISYLIPAAQCDLDLSTSDKGILTGMTFFGIMVASYPFGYLGDTQGRRHVILIALFGSTMCTIISTFISNFTLFVICRFFSGFFVGGYSATSYAYIGEFNTNKNRSTILSWVSTAVGLASTLMPLTALWILSYDWRFPLYEGYEFRPWRLLILIYVLPGIISWIMLYCMPESPKYLLSQGRDEEALKVIQWIYRKNKGKRNHDDIVILKLKPESGEMSENNYKGMKGFMSSLASQTFPLFKPPYALHFLICCLLHFGTFSVAGGIALFIPDTLNRLSHASRPGMKICEVLQMNLEATSNGSIVEENICIDKVNPSVYIDSTYIGVAFFMTFILLSLTIKRLGRRKIFVFTFVISSSSGFVLPFVTSHAAIIGLYCSFILFCGINVTVINSALIDLIPTHLRSMAVCVAMMFGRLGSTVSTNLIGSLLEQNCTLTYNVFSSMVVICLLVSFLLPNGSLE